MGTPRLNEEQDTKDEEGEKEEKKEEEAKPEVVENGEAKPKDDKEEGGKDDSGAGESEGGGAEEDNAKNTEVMLSFREWKNRIVIMDCGLKGINIAMIASQIQRVAHLGRLTDFACKSFSIVNPRDRQLKATSLEFFL